MRYKNGEVFEVGCNVENYQSPSKPKRQNKHEIQDFRKGREDDLPHVRIPRAVFLEMWCKQNDVFVRSSYNEVYPL